MVESSWQASKFIHFDSEAVFAFWINQGVNNLTIGSHHLISQT